MWTAVGAAREAFDHGPWPRTTLDERLAVLRRLSEDMAAHHDEMADVVTDEMGCPITQSRTMQVTSARAIHDSYLELAADYPFQSVRPSSMGAPSWSASRWGRRGGRALEHAAGRGHAEADARAPDWVHVVFKPAPETPLDAYRLAEMVADAGLPAGSSTSSGRPGGQ